MPASPALKLCARVARGRRAVRLAVAVASLMVLAACRPAGAGVVNGTDTILPGQAQLETEVTFLRDTSGGQPVHFFLTSPSLRIGLTGTLDVSLGGDLFVRERGGGQGNSGLGDTTLTATWRLADDQGWHPSLGLLPYVKFPTASQSKGFGTGRVDFGGGVAIGKDLPGRLHVDLNLGLTAVGQTESPGGLFPQRSAGAAVSWGLAEAVTLYWEIFYASRDTPSGVASVGTDIGLTLNLSQRIQWEHSVGFGLAGAQPDWTLFSRLVILLGPLPAEAARSPAYRPPEPPVPPKPPVHRPQR